MHTIVDAPTNPSTDDVIDAFKRAYYEKPRRLPVTISDWTSGGAGNFTLLITGLRYESGSPGMFLISGMMYNGDESMGDFDGFYDGRHRTGHVTLR